MITKPTRPERGRERSSLSSCRSRPWCRWASSPSPWALPASAWAGFITHSRARCEIGSIAPARFAPIREQPCATQHTACTGGGDPPLAPPSSRAPASYRCTRCRPPLPPQRAISKSLHTPSHPPTLRCTPALEVGQARVRAAAAEETAEVKAGSAARAVAGLERGGSLTPLLPFPCHELTYDPCVPVRSATSR